MTPPSPPFYEVVTTDTKRAALWADASQRADRHTESKMRGVNS